MNGSIVVVRLFFLLYTLLTLGDGLLCSRIYYVSYFDVILSSKEVLLATLLVILVNFFVSCSTKEDPITISIGFLRILILLMGVSSSVARCF